jgi:cellulose synthase/poly-beta-1,6-N-acetylglucosamine synthase-like glycosyltransferase
MLRLGDILVAHGALPRERLEHHMAAAKGRIGAFLHAHGAIGPQALARAVAEQRGAPFIDLRRDPPDPGLFRARDMEHCLAERYLPHSRAGGILTVACCEPSRALGHLLKRRYGHDIKLRTTTARDLATALAQVGKRHLTRQARHGLRRRHRTLSAARTLMPHQARGLGVVLVLVAIGLGAHAQGGWHLLLAACNLFYFFTLAFKLYLYVQGRDAARALAALEERMVQALPTLAEEALPVYSILVPLYRESANVLARLIRALDGLDYPKEKLDIKLICEADDTDTFAALRHLRPPQTMEILAVPPSAPRTKPKACNVALAQVRGEFVVIFDAEDAPAPDQLKRAVWLFAQSDARVACLQAPLNYYNRAENLLTQLFALEYGALFCLQLPALARLGLPIPLGGTSNHLRVAALREAGAWDPFNVTEDADLGMRLCYLGYRTRVLPSITLEEAPITLCAWMRQRTRWIKGYLQTWLVYTRDAATLKRRLGPRAYYGFQFFIGAPALTFLLAPLLWGVCLIAPFGLLPLQLAPWLWAICAVAFVGGVASNLLYARAVIVIERWPAMRAAMLAYPFYWLLHSAACARAVWQLATAPHYWEKTTHGVSRLFGNSEKA